MPKDTSSLALNTFRNYLQYMSDRNGLLYLSSLLLFSRTAPNPTTNMGQTTTSEKLMHLTEWNWNAFSSFGKSSVVHKNVLQIPDVLTHHSKLEVGGPNSKILLQIRSSQKTVLQPGLSSRSWSPCPRLKNEVAPVQ